MIGQTISHYRVLSRLGEGGMGVVYLAEDLTLRRKVALKFLPVDLAADPEARARLIHEAQAAAALLHPHICPIHEVAESDGKAFLVMAYLEGQTLRERLREGPLPLGEALTIARQIGGALAAAHAKGIIHRDVKPANVMLTASGAVLTDFGLAVVSGASRLTRTGSTVGTAAYLSPEQVRGADADERADVWALGVVLYEMVSGRLPFGGEQEQALFYAILNQDPGPVASRASGLPAGLDGILGKALAKEPGKRYAKVAGLVGDLETLVQDREALPAGRARKRRPGWLVPASASAALVAVAVVVALVATTWMTRGRRESPAPPAHGRTDIAVLPFQNLSVESPYAYFSGGLHEELLTQLAKIAALKVISRTSAMGYEGTKKPLKQIAAELGVGSIVEGSVQVEGNRLRVNVQLIDAATDEHLWAERYDRTLNDAFAIQSDVAQRIVEAVGAVLTSDERASLAASPTADAEAYRFYLQAWEYCLRPAYLRQNLEVAQRLLEQALERDSKFALAHAALSQVHGWMYWLRYDPSPRRAEHQRREAQTALQLAPDLPQAHVAMGLAYYYGRRDYRGALSEYEIALRGMPNDGDLWYQIGAVNRRMGNWREVLAALERAMQLDPRHPDVVEDLGGLTCGFLHRYEQSIRMFDRALALAPDLYVAAVERGWTYVAWQGQFDTLRAALDRIPRGAPLSDKGTVADQRASLFFHERDAESLLQELQLLGEPKHEEKLASPFSVLRTGWAYYLRGDRVAAHAAFDSARRFLDKAVKERSDDWRVHAARGLALARSGEPREALREVEWLRLSRVYREDAYEGGMVAEYLAMILVQAGKPDAALEEIDRLLRGPSWVSVHTLRLDPYWDPIREHPRFKALLVKYANPEQFAY